MPPKNLLADVAERTASNLAERYQVPEPLATGFQTEVSRLIYLGLQAAAAEFQRNTLIESSKHKP